MRFNRTLYAFLGTSILACACSSAPDLVGGSMGPTGSEAGAVGDTSGNGGNGGNGAGQNLNIDAGDDAGSVGMDTGTCAADAERVALVPLDMGLGVDTSYSMDFDDKWIQVRDALNVFAKNPNYANMGVALQFFPIREQCNVSQYGSPLVPMQVLPGVQPAFSSAVDAQRMFGGTPLVQVMQGMIAYMRTWSMAHVGRKPVLVLATDGIPDDTCSASDIDPSNSLDNALALAKDAFEGQPSIPVFVIGVGEELTALNAIAKAGGTGSAAVIATTGNVTEKFLAALDDIRRTALSCDYAIPPHTSGAIDYDAVNVTFREGSAKAETFYYVGTADDCKLSATGAWYYDDPKMPTKVVLCPQTCERVSATADGKMAVTFGCKRNDIK